MKKLILVLTALVLVFSMAACGDDTTTKKAENAIQSGRPENFDEKAELLKLYNGIMQATTLEEMRPYVTDDITDAQLQKLVDEQNEMAKQYPEMRRKMTSVVSMEVIDQFEGYDVVIWEMTDDESSESSLIPSVEQGGIFPLKIQNGHYVTNLNEEFSTRFHETYTICHTCIGSGKTQVPTQEPCPHCSGSEECYDEPFAGIPSTDISLGEGTIQFVDPETIEGFTVNGTVPDGSIQFVDPGMTEIPTVNGISPEMEDMIVDSDLIIDSGLDGSYYPGGCYECHYTGFVTTEEDCPDCQGKGYLIHK